MTKKITPEQKWHQLSEAAKKWLKNSLTVSNAKLS
jgi:hypothetical protein